MIISYIDNVMFKKMLLGAAINLENNKGLVDSLNIFPVPDGDTGTNMNLTVQSAVKEINSLSESTISNLAEAASKGSLMGARGNSGVILSQLFRGFSKSVDKCTRLDCERIALAFKEAAAIAYKAVMKPVEGTILTVARETAETAIEIYTEYNDTTLFLEELIRVAKLSLDRTPDLLPVLKQAGVVDAGGKGLLCLLEGALASLKGLEIKKQNLDSETIEDTSIEVAGFGSEDEIIFMYCTEFMIKDANISHEEFLPQIVEDGDSIVCVGIDGIIKVHIHTNNPGLVFVKALKHGELINLKIENMKEQFRNRPKETGQKKSSEIKKYGFIAVGYGEGIKKVFYDLNVDYFIEGGQTMNPSTEDILAAEKEINAQNIFVLPNNSNITMAAEQAKKLSDKNLIVIPTKTIPQGISAMIAFNEEDELEQNVSEMKEAMNNVKTGQVTYAVRDTVVNDMEINKNDIIGLTGNGKDIVSHGTDLEEQTIEVLNKLVDEDNFLITLFYGNAVEEKLALKLKSKVEELFDYCDVEMVDGGQPLYYYIISVE